MGESISTIQRSPRISTSYKFAALAIGCRRWPCRRFRWASNLACQRHWKIAQSCRSPKDKVSARLRYHVSNSVVFVHRAGTLAKNIRPLSKLFSKAEPLPFEKEININLVYSSCLKHANVMLLGDPRQADQRTQSFPFPIVIHQSHSTLLLERSSAKLLVFTCTYRWRPEVYRSNGISPVTTRVVIALWALTREVNSLRWVVGLSFRLLEAIPKSSFLSDLFNHPSEAGEKS